MTDIVVAAAIVRGGRLLAVRRTEPPRLAGKWELAGGKVEVGEDDVTAVARECLEELAVSVVVGDRVGPDVSIGSSWELHAYAATTDDEPQLLEHSELRWLAADELGDVDWLPGDLPLLPYLAELLG